MHAGMKDYRAFLSHNVTYVHHDGLVNSHDITKALEKMGLQHSKNGAPFSIPCIPGRDFSGKSNLIAELPDSSIKKLVSELAKLGVHLKNNEKGRGPRPTPGGIKSGKVSHAVW